MDQNDDGGVDGGQWQGQWRRTTTWATTIAGSMADATTMVGSMADVGGVDNGGQGQWELRMPGSAEDGGRVNGGG